MSVHVQPLHAVAYVVPSSSDRASYQKDSGALQEVLKALVYLEPKKTPTVIEKLTTSGCHTPQLTESKASIFFGSHR